MQVSRRLLWIFVFVLFGLASNARAEQTIVFFRHAEKPASGLGQLTCQGLNRALQLPDVLFARFGKPDWAYAPNPNVKIDDATGSYYYVRPLTTIEPTAIRAGLSVNTKYGYSEISGLQSLLITPSKANSTIYVSWEHQYLVKIVQSIMNAYGRGVTVPAWVTGDYDSLYVVHVNYSSSGSISARFEHDFQGLNGQAASCP
jgi:hypothetical protein